MNSLRFRLLLVAILALLALASVTTALAAKPEVQTFHDEGSFEIDCGSFLALADFEEDARVTTFFDDAGNPVRIQVHVNYDGTLTNSVTGLTVRDPGHFTIQVDLHEGTQNFVGLVYGITIPGEGVVVLDAGRVVFAGEAVEENIIFEAGQFDVLHGGDAVICAALD